MATVLVKQRLLPKWRVEWKAPAEAAAAARAAREEQAAQRAQHASGAGGLNSDRAVARERAGSCSQGSEQAATQAARGAGSQRGQAFHATRVHHRDLDRAADRFDVLGREGLARLGLEPEVDGFAALLGRIGGREHSPCLESKRTCCALTACCESEAEHGFALPNTSTLVSAWRLLKLTGSAQL